LTKNLVLSSLQRPPAPPVPVPRSCAGRALAVLVGRVQARSAWSHVTEGPRTSPTPPRDHAPWRAASSALSATVARWFCSPHRVGPGDLRAPPPRWGTPILGPHWGARVALTRLTRGLAVGKGVRQARSGDVSPRRCGSLQPLRCPAMRWGGARGIPLSPCVLTLTLTPTPTLTLLESSSRVSPQAVRSWDRPPFRHIKNQSCFLGSGSRFRWTNLGPNPGARCVVHPALPLVSVTIPRSLFLPARWRWY
jgi:hypothetical protein